MRNLFSFQFTEEEINAHKDNGATWHKFVRGKEMEMILSLLVDNKFSQALELGAGGCFQAKALVDKCDKCVCTEYLPNGIAAMGIPFEERTEGNIEFRLCDAQDLHIFDDSSFDLFQ